MSMETSASVGSGGSAASLSGAATGAALRLPRRSLGGLIAISIFWFALNFHWAALLLLLIPAQVTELLLREAPGATLAAQSAWVSDHRALTLALVSAPGLIVALVANPLFGLFSDRTPGRFGRRRPYIVGGTLLNAVALGVMALAPLAFSGAHSGNALGPSLLILTGGLMLAQLANNAAAAPFHALLPDLVPEEQRGAASGIMGLALFLGQIGGAVAPTLFGFNSDALLKGTQRLAAFQQGIVLSYATVAGVILLMALLTAIFVRETPWKRATLPSQQVQDTREHTARDLLLTVVVMLVIVVALYALLQAHLGLSLNTDTLNVLQLLAVILVGIGAARAFGFRPRRNPDFSWVVLTRMLVMMGVYMVQSFLDFYMRDVAHASSPEVATTDFIILLTLAALVSTLAAGWLSDRFGRKRMVYISGTFMAIVGAAFILAPYLLPGHVLPLALAAGAVFGLGYGAYISVDWALVADVLPSDATFARDMGVWNIGLTLPQVFAVVLGGWLLALGATTGHTQLGYTLLFAWFVIFCVAGTVTVRNIRSVKR